VRLAIALGGSVLASALLYGSTPAAAQEIPEAPAIANAVEEMRVALDARLDTLEKQGFSGVVLVALKGKTAYARGLGYAKCDSTELMTTEHVFLIGSITKEFLRVVTYKLEEEGHLRLDDPIGQFIPDLPDDKAALTVRQLIYHSAGLPDIVDASGRPVPYSLAYDYENVTRDEMLRRFAKTDLFSNPGETEKYSNLGYQVLAVVLEEAAGATIEDLLHSRVFRPAGMTRTGYVAPDWSAAKFAEGCHADATRWGSPYVDGMWMEDGPSWNLRGAGGLLGTAEDLSRFMNALKRQLIFGPEAQERYLRDRLVRFSSYKDRGMGPAGSNGIFSAVFFWLRVSDFRFVILSNRANQIGESYARELIRMAVPAR
jgi:CubicO group peptidase (beta-lactamase class C family)